MVQPMNVQGETIYWENFEVGRVVPLGEKTVTEDEIVAFGLEFDPQPMHTDPEAASESMFGGLIASGWHSCALLMRMICDAYLLESSSLGSPGLDEINFLAPVRPGDTLKGQMTCLETRALGSRPEVGIVKIFYEVFSQDGDCVLTWRCNQFFRRRPGAGAP